MDLLEQKLLMDGLGWCQPWLLETELRSSEEQHMLIIALVSCCQREVYKVSPGYASCGGLSENGPHRFMYLNIWFPVGGLYRKD